MSSQENRDRTRGADSFTPDGIRANPHPLSGTFPPSLAQLRDRIPAAWRLNVGVDFPAEHRGMDWAALRAAHAAGMTEAERDEAEADYYRTLENDRRRS